MIPLNWDRRQLPGHCGLLRLLNQQERKGATELNTKGKGDCPSMVEVRKRGDSSQVTPFNTNLLQPVQGGPTCRSRDLHSACWQSSVAS